MTGPGARDRSAVEPDPVRIWVLPPAIADAIAAGEVVERPASVVKELVENALDAGAGRVRVEIEEGGRTGIRVSDDGGGMSPEELRLAFGRHATSKVRSLSDLDRIATLGFRGEALASIGAVARVEAVSRRLAGAAAHRVVVRGAEVEGPMPAAAPVGTSLEVTELFATTPARRAFLGAPRTEAIRCARVVADAALSRPDVAFELHVDGRRTLRAPGSGELLDAVRAVFGAPAARDCFAVEEGGDEFAVTGLLGGPAAARGNRSALVLCVNGRRVQQRSLEVAVETAYRGRLEVGRHPLAVLDLRCDPGRVDVNVHPTKREVRFRDERAAFQAMERACWRALGAAAVGAAPASRGAEIWQGSSAPGAAPTPSRAPAPAAPAPGDPRRRPAGPALEWSHGPGETVGPRPAALNGPALAHAGAWRLLGQAHRQYLVGETDDGLVLVDQHAAHERVLYARYLARLEAEADAVASAPAGARPPAPAQGWLIPELVELPAELSAGFPGARATLSRLGFQLEIFGEATLRCTASPPGVRAGDVDRLVTGLLEAALDGPPGAETMRRHRMAALLACHTAVRFGDRIAPEGAQRLLRDLAGTPAPSTCPHGRPTVVHLGDAELRRAFRRPPA